MTIETVGELTGVFADSASTALGSRAVSYLYCYCFPLEADPDLTCQTTSHRFLHCYTIFRGNCSVDLSVIGGPGQPLLALVLPVTPTSPSPPGLIFLHAF